MELQLYYSRILIPHLTSYSHWGWASNWQTEMTDCVWALDEVFLCNQLTLHNKVRSSPHWGLAHWQAAVFLHSGSQLRFKHLIEFPYRCHRSHEHRPGTIPFFEDTQKGIYLPDDFRLSWDHPEGTGGKGWGGRAHLLRRAYIWNCLCPRNSFKIRTAFTPTWNSPLINCSAMALTPGIWNLPTS